MTKSTDTKNIKFIVRGLLKKYGLLDEQGEPMLQAEIDFTTALVRYMFERETGESPAAARLRVTREYDIENLISLTRAAAPRLAMQARVEAAVKKSPNWDDLKSGWNDFDLWLLEREKIGETIEGFMTWYNSDEFRVNNNLWLTPYRIKEFWQRAFEKKSEIAQPDSDGGFR